MSSLVRKYVTGLMDYDDQPTRAGVIYLEAGADPSKYAYEDLFIEDLSAAPSYTGTRKWYLVIGRCEFVSDDLAELEEKLMEWAKGEGYDVPDQFPPLYTTK
jgi:hypothetical protein